jgi:hypothetical protein
MWCGIIEVENPIVGRTRFTYFELRIIESLLNITIILSQNNNNGENDITNFYSDNYDEIGFSLVDVLELGLQPSSFSFFIGHTNKSVVKTHNM